jgi:hypothetical protein
MRHCVTEQRGRICPELSKHVGGVAIEGREGRRGRSQPTDQMRGNSKEVGRVRTGCEGP